MSSTELSVCPSCNTSENVIKIVYGYPKPSLMEDSNKGNVKLGGCCPRVRLSLELGFLRPFMVGRLKKEAFLL